MMKFIPALCSGTPQTPTEQGKTKQSAAAEADAFLDSLNKGAAEQAGTPSQHSGGSPAAPKSDARQATAAKAGPSAGGGLERAPAFASEGVRTGNKASPRPTPKASIPSAVGRDIKRQTLSL